MGSYTNVGFSGRDIPRLKECIKQAEKEEKQDFKYRDLDFDVQYAKYLVEYLETRLSN
jgi:hypothetical protein|tara:strand:+ start:363 stop:536 length:174 start_codon:yes stop_codon:yes gene_type:complete